MPAKKDAQWWADYRAKKKANNSPSTTEPVIAEGSLGAVAAVQGVRRDTRVVDRDTGEIKELDVAKIPKRSGYRMLPGDDWVSKLTQSQRDEILNHPAIKSAKRG